MEIQTFPPQHPTRDYRSNVDTSSPFRSVKEAVAIFGERFLTSGIYSPKTISLPKQETTSWITTTTFSPSPQNPKQENVQDSAQLETALKRLESDLEETKMELKLLKERESETEVAIASLNAELHLNMSKMAQAEAAVAAKAVAVANRESLMFGGREKEEENSKRDLIMRIEDSPTLAHILSQKEGSFAGGGGKGRKMMKRKPIIPLVWELFSRKKESSSGIHNALYSSSFVEWN